MLPIAWEAVRVQSALNLARHQLFELGEKFGAHDVISVEWLLENKKQQMKKKCTKNENNCHAKGRQLLLLMLLLLLVLMLVLLTKLNVFVLTTNTEYKLRNALKRNNQFTS